MPKELSNNEEQPTQESIETLYSMGHQLYENGKYKEAMDVFRVLTMMNKGNKKHWIGLGASYQMLKEYDRALQSYGYAALLDENDPVPHFHAGECFLAQGKQKEGHSVLKIAKRVAMVNKEKYNYILKRLELLQATSDQKEEQT